MFILQVSIFYTTNHRLFLRRFLLIFSFFIHVKLILRCITLFTFYLPSSFTILHFFLNLNHLFSYFPSGFLLSCILNKSRDASFLHLYFNIPFSFTIFHFFLILNHYLFFLIFLLVPLFMHIK